MEYYDIYDQNYVRLAKNENKIVLAKIEVLDHSEYVIYEITDDIIIASENYSKTYAQGLQAKLIFEIYNRDHKYDTNENSPFWFDTKFKYYKGLKDIYTGDIYWFSKGVFTTTSVSQEDDIISINAVDKFGLLTSETGGACLENATKISLGDKVGQMFVDMLSQSKGNGKPTDPVAPIIDFDTREIELGEDLELSTGAYFGDVFTDLAYSLKCRLKYDNVGHMVLTRGSSDFEFKNKAPMWEFDDKVTAEFVSASLEYNFTEVKNRITVWGENFDGASFVAVAENDNPKSPVRISLVGYRVANTLEDMFGYEQENVDAYAEMYLKMKTIVGMGVKMNCTMLPHLDVEDVVLIRNEKLGLDNQRFLISDVSINGNEMSISLTNVDSLPEFEEFK